MISYEEEAIALATFVICLSLSEIDNVLRKSKMGPFIHIFGGKDIGLARSVLDY